MADINQKDRLSAQAETNPKIVKSDFEKEGVKKGNSMKEYLRSVGEIIIPIVTGKVENVKSEKVEKFEEIESDKTDLEREQLDDMERASEELAAYYIALERGDDHPEMTVWGTYEDYLRALGEAVVEGDADENKYDPEEDPDDPFFLGVDINDPVDPPVDLVPLVKMEVNNGL